MLFHFHVSLISGFFLFMSLYAGFLSEFSFSLVFSNWILICSFLFLLSCLGLGGFADVLGYVGLQFSSNMENLWNFFKNCFLSTFLSFSYSNYMYVKWLNIVRQAIKIAVLFFSVFFSVCFHILIVSIAISSWLLTFYSVIYYLLLSHLVIFYFIWDVIFFQSKTSKTSFYIFSKLFFPLKLWGIIAALKSLPTNSVISDIVQFVSNGWFSPGFG